MADHYEVLDSDPAVPLENAKWTNLHDIEMSVDLSGAENNQVDATGGNEVDSTEDTNVMQIEGHIEADAEEYAEAEAETEAEVETEMRTAANPGETHTTEEPPTTGDQRPEVAAGAAAAAEVPETTFEHSRRRRFDFSKWVEREKKTHEMIYKNKISYFHGALSDSEDEDFQEDDEDEVPSQIPNEEDTNEFERRELALLEETGEATESVPVKRRPQFVSDGDSDDSSSSSNSNSSFDNHSNISSDDSLAEVLVKRLNEPIAASRDAMPDSLEDSIPEAPSGMEYLEARENHDRIDYMLPQKSGGGGGGRSSSRSLSRSRSVRSRQQHQMHLTAVVDELGSRAPMAMRVAARTARVRSKGSQARQADNPLRKYFAGHNPEGQKVLNQWKSGRLRLSHTSQHQQQHRNLSPQEDSGWKQPQHSLAASRRSSKRGDFAEQAEASLTSLQKLFDQPHRRRRRQKPRKKRRYASEVPESKFTTTVLERPVPSHKDAVARNMWPTIEHQRALKSSSVSGSAQRVIRDSTTREQLATPSERMGPASTASHKQPKLVVKVKRDSPTRFFQPELLPATTFVGSGIIRLIDLPIVWEYSPTSIGFGTAMDVANEVQVASDADHIYELCLGNGVSLTVLPLYSYFIQSTAYLCDESQIVEPKFRKFVLHTWIRLARRLLRGLLGSYRHLSNSVRLVIELVTLSALILSKRVAILDPHSKNGEKARHLTIWVVYYFQQHISRQIDLVHYKNVGEVVGAELAYIAGKLNIFSEDLLLQVFSKGSSTPDQIAANWHLLVLATAVTSSPGTWNMWSLNKHIMGGDSESVYISMSYAQILMSKWKWPGSVEALTDYFNFHTRNRNTTDPRGEQIWLPSFLTRSRFDGTNRPSGNFALFLELLGLNLQLFYNDSITCRRIRGRMTPLSALSFPETNSISQEDLSMATYQYGILIILYRFLPVGLKPSIRQIRDLVVLRESHLVIRIKAVSAWEILSHMVDDDQDTVECHQWMQQDILQQGNVEELVPVPDPLLYVALRSSSRLETIETIPLKALIPLGLGNATNQTVRSLSFKILARHRSMISSSLFEQLLIIHDHYSDDDCGYFARCVLQCSEIFYQNADEILAKEDSNEDKSKNQPESASGISSHINDVIIKITSEIISLKFAEFTQKPLYPTLVTILTKILLLPRLTETGKQLLKACRLITISPTDISRTNIHPEQLNACRSFFTQENLPMKSQWEYGLKQCSRNLAQLPTDTLKSAYLPIVVSFRKHAFALHSDLSRLYAMKVSGSLRALENMQRNVADVIEIVHGMGLDSADIPDAELAFQSEKSKSCFYFFAYKLHDLVETAVSQTNKENGFMFINDEQFIDEACDVVDNISSPEGEAAYMALVAYAFPAIFLLAYHNPIPGFLAILPSLLKAAKTLLLRFSVNKRANCFPLLTIACEFLFKHFDAAHIHMGFEYQCYMATFGEFCDLASYNTADFFPHGDSGGTVTPAQFLCVADTIDLIQTKLVCQSAEPTDVRPSTLAFSGGSIAERSAAFSYQMNDVVRMFSYVSRKILDLQPPDLPSKDTVWQVLKKKSNRTGRVSDLFIIRFTNRNAAAYLALHDRWSCLKYRQ